MTSSIFSDFGPRHEITDATGEPTQTLAISNVEVIEDKPKLLQVEGVKEGEEVGQREEAASGAGRWRGRHVNQSPRGKIE